MAEKHAILDVLKRVQPRWEDIIEPFSRETDEKLAVPGTGGCMAYFITDGIVSLEYTGEKNKKHAVNLFGRNDVVGCKSLFEEDHSPFAPVTKTSVRGFAVSIQAAQKIMSDSAMSREVLLRHRSHLSNRQEFLFTARTCFKKSSEAHKAELVTAAIIAMVAVLVGDNLIPMAQLRFADLSGQPRPALTNYMKKLRNDGFLKYDRATRGRFTVADLDGLINLVGPMFDDVLRSEMNFSAWLDHASRKIAA